MVWVPATALAAVGAIGDGGGTAFAIAGGIGRGGPCTAMMAVVLPGATRMTGTGTLGSVGWSNCGTAGAGGAAACFGGNTSAIRITGADRTMRVASPLTMA
jgi:hypothetical protein